ncbi:MAG: CocE/NonD family hydrolase [Candidatus Poribacteria bacterium]
MKFSYNITILIGILSILATTEVALPAPTITDMVPMRDGVKLATDVYLPKGDSPFPVIFVATPYNKKGLEAWALAANMRGYALVGQDFRGRFDSEGVDYPVFLSYGWGEHQDGYDTIEWIASQKWCNGKVGTLGMSAPAIAQNMTAPSKPPHLVCQYVVVGYSSAYHQSAYQGGALRKNLWERWLNDQKFNPENMKLAREHPSYDDYWKAQNTELVANRVNVPSMFVGGWYDIFCIGTINSFMTINKNGGIGAKGKCRLVMEAYGHGRNQEVVFPNSELPKNADMLNWFDIWMKNDGKGAENIPTVQYFVMGDPADKSANVWKSANDWRVPAKTTPFYFIADKTLQAQPTKESKKTLSYKYDPKNPVPTMGGDELYDPKGPMDQKDTDNRPDVLVFTSQAIDQPLEVVGNIKVKLWASSSAVDTDFTAKLCDVYPDGKSIIVADGIIRACYRNSFEKRKLLKPKDIYEFEIDLWDTAILFSKSHKIRVAISSSNSPRFEPNPNTGKPSGTDDETIIAENTIYLDRNHPSRIILPIVSP